MLAPKARVELARPFGQWFLSSLPPVLDRPYTTTSVHILPTSPIWIGRPWASATPQQPRANGSSIGGKLGGKSCVVVLGFLLVR